MKNKIIDNDKVEFAVTGINEILAVSESFRDAFDSLKSVADELNAEEKKAVYSQYLEELDSEWVLGGEKKGMKELFAA